MSESDPTSEDQHGPIPDSAPKRVHILGTGSIGKFVAHSLRNAPEPPPVTLLFHRPNLLKEFDENGHVIELVSGNDTTAAEGFDAELALPERKDLGTARSHDNREKFEDQESNEPIHNLIVTVKAFATVSALTPIAHRLTPESTILFLQNGMGVVEECNEKLFPDPEARPNYMQGVNSHGVFAGGSFQATHAGAGVIYLGLLPRIPSEYKGKAGNQSQAPDGQAPPWATSSRYLLRMFTRIPVLGSVALNSSELLQAQLDKLAVNCLVNPLTVIMDNRNGQLLNNFAISRTMYMLLAEISLVIQSLPQLHGVPNVKTRFASDRLESLAVTQCQKTAQNISSMLQDVRRGAQTEIEYINGYIVKKGEELGIKAVMNYMLMQMVIGKQQMISKEVDNYVPMKHDKA